MNAAVELSQVTVRFERRRADPFYALRDLDLSVATGEVTCLLGPNGSGKTTTINVITGLLAVTAGSVRVLGLDPAGTRRVWVAELPGDGVVGLGELVRVSRSTLEIAYSVHIDHWGRGLGTPIGTLLVGQAFGDPDVERVQATCDPR